MADIQHRDIPSQDCHEPKNISNASVEDAGKVLTPSGTTGGTSVLRFLSLSDITDGGVVSEKAYGILAADNSISKTLPANETEAVDLLSLFDINSQSNVSLSNNQLTLGAEGTYFFTFCLQSQSSASSTFTLQYSLNSQEPEVIGSGFSASGTVFLTFGLSVSEGNTIRLLGVSDDSNTVTISLANTISLVKVS